MKEEVILWDKNNFEDGLKVYTDGSGQQGMIGVAAVLYVNSIKKDELYYQLGTDRQHTVFEGELVAILMGLHLARDWLDKYPAIDICTDNQATIKSIGNSHSQPVQYIIEEIRFTIKQLFSTEQVERCCNRIIGRQTSLRLTWVAGHEGSTGNEAVDVLAKAATEFSSSGRDLLPDRLKNTLPNSVVASKQDARQITKLSFKKWWKQSKGYRRVGAIDPSLPLKNFILNTGDLTFNQTSILTQL